MVIRKGHHRVWPWRIGIWFRKSSIKRKVVFDWSCKYDLKGDDQYDTNKLFGIGYFPGHHHESARFGWRYDIGKQRIVISAYCYVKGDRIIIDLCDVYPGRQYILTLDMFPMGYEFHVYNEFADRQHMLAEYMVNSAHNKRWAYPLSLFFGGNKPAPQNIIINIKKA